MIRSPNLRLQSHFAAMIMITAALLSCRDSEKVVTGQEEVITRTTTETHSSNPLSDPTVGNYSAREFARSNLLRDDLISPGVLEESVTLLRKLTKELAREEDLSSAEALNEIYLALINGQSPLVLSGLSGLFGEVMMSDPEGISSIMGGLPPGELRRLGIAFIRGKGLSHQELEEVYKAMPESVDRLDIAKELVTRSFWEKGIDSALSSIDLMDVSSGRNLALQSLASYMSTSEQFGGRAVTKEDLEKVRLYAESIGQVQTIRRLDSLGTPDQ